MKLRGEPFTTRARKCLVHLQRFRMKNGIQLILQITCVFLINIINKQYSWQGSIRSEKLINKIHILTAAINSTNK